MGSEGVFMKIDAFISFQSGGETAVNESSPPAADESPDLEFFIGEDVIEVVDSFILEGGTNIHDILVLGEKSITHPCAQGLDVPTADESC